MENRQQLVTEAGTRDSLLWEVDGIRLGHAISRFNSLDGFSASNHRDDVIRLHLGLRGNYSFHYKQLGQDFHLIGGHHNIFYSQEFDMTVEPHSLELETFGVQFPRETFLKFTSNANDLLKRFADEILNGQNTILSDHWGAIDPAIHQLIRQIVENPYKGDLQQLFLLSKSIELLVLCAESCDQARQRAPVYIKDPSDKEKLNAVRELINERLDSPPNLSEIARTVGLNEYKLKRGFKELFRTTVFGYLSEQRLLLARQYLQDTQKTAAEIAAQLGYATPQHFNNAFKKRFGNPPSKDRKNP